jgi:hypothetical protein
MVLVVVVVGGGVAGGSGGDEAAAVVVVVGTFHAEIEAGHSCEHCPAGCPCSDRLISFCIKG